MRKLVLFSLRSLAICVFAVIMTGCGKSQPDIAVQQAEDAKWKIAAAAAEKERQETEKALVAQALEEHNRQAEASDASARESAAARVGKSQGD